MASEVVSKLDLRSAFFTIEQNGKKVKKDDVVKQGDIIGKSGTSNFSKDLGDHLHFELIYKGQAVNPEEYYEKELGDL